MNDKKELTLTAILLGTLISVVFGAANAYLGLRVGLTVSASIPAAVVSMGVLRFILRRDSILENNMVQTIGSAGESLVAGAVFTMPALYLWAEEGLCAPPGFVRLTVIALCGGALGVLLMVPVRKPFIVDEDATLAYPEGRACADVLRAGEKGASQARDVFSGLGTACCLKLVTDFFKWLPSSGSFAFPKLRGELGFEVSAALAGVGYIVGPKVATLVFSGSFLGWMVLIPLFCAFHGPAALAYEQGGAVAVWKDYVRYVGAGAIATGGMISLFKSFPAFAAAFRDALSSSRVDAPRRGGGDIPLRRVVPAVIAVIVIIALVPQVPVGIGGALMIALFGFFFAVVSARMVGLVGSSNNPVSGMTIATLVVSAFVLKTCGVAGAAGMVAAISVGSVVCIIAAMAGDTAQDLKTGWLLGATAWKQQVGELIGAGVAAFAVAGVLLLLHKAWGFGSEEISAPQAMLMKSVTEGIMGGTLPWELLFIGAGIALVLALCRLPVMPCALGIYLPVKLNATIFAGGMLRLLAERFRPASASRGTLFSAGLIAGEGICGILLAVYMIVK